MLSIPSMMLLLCSIRMVLLWWRFRRIGGAVVSLVRLGGFMAQKGKRIADEVRQEYLEWLMTPPTEREPRTKSEVAAVLGVDRKSTRLNSSHVKISYAVFC